MWKSCNDSIGCPQCANAINLTDYVQTRSDIFFTFNTAINSCVRKIISLVPLNCEAGEVNRCNWPNIDRTGAGVVQRLYEACPVDTCSDTQIKRLQRILREIESE